MRSKLCSCERWWIVAATHDIALDTSCVTPDCSCLWEPCLLTRRAIACGTPLPPFHWPISMKPPTPPLETAAKTSRAANSTTVQQQQQANHPRWKNERLSMISTGIPLRTAPETQLISSSLLVGPLQLGWWVAQSPGSNARAARSRRVSSRVERRVRLTSIR